MRIFLTLLTALSLIVFVSCDKESNSIEMAGNISGLGSNTGKLEISEKFEFPEDVIASEIIGFEEDLEQAAFNLKSGNNVNCFHYGSGSRVILKVTLQNTSRVERTVFFPKGLIWEAKTPGYQHGLQIQTVWVSLKANQTKTVVIHLFCANKSLSSSDANGSYHILGVTASKILGEFLELIGWRKVNVEMSKENSRKSAEGPSMEEITERMQKIVHQLTDLGTGLSDDDRIFIERIPQLDESKRPVLDQKGNYPLYFKDLQDLE